MVALVQDAPQDDEPEKSVEFIFGFVKDFPERQAHDWEAMETKAVQILTAASVVVGLASLGARSDTLPVVQAVIFGLGLVAYLVVVQRVAAVLGIRDIRRSRQAKFLWDNRRTPVKDLQASMVEDIIKAYGENVAALEEKAHNITLALRALAVEATAVIAALILTRLLP